MCPCPRPNSGHQNLLSKVTAFQVGELRDTCGRLLTASEVLFRWNRKDTFALRAQFLALQHDTELMLLLVEGFNPQDVDRSDIAEHLRTLLNFIGKLSGDTIPEAQRHLEALSSPSDRDAFFSSTIFSVRSTFEQLSSLFSRSFKRCWRYQWKTKNTSKKVIPSCKLPQVNALLTSFSVVPFGIGAERDVFIEATPSNHDEVLHLEQYQYWIERLAETWTSHELSEPVLEHLAHFNQTLLELLWNCGVDSIKSINSTPFHSLTPGYLREWRILTDDLANGLRDGLLRARKSRMSMVIVGTQDAGKSTFINAFIGANLLPTSLGLTTTHPCRIRHSLDAQIPVLHMNPKYLNDCINWLRTGRWHAKVVAMLKGQWLGLSGLPPGVDFADMKHRWTELSGDMPEHLKAMTDEGFQFPSKVEGAAAIQETLNNMNIFVKICRNLPVGFDHLEPDDWPVIETRFGSSNSFNLPPGFELIDIPGIGGPSEHRWEESTREIIRQSTVVIALVSLQFFRLTSWDLIPKLISEGSFLQVSAVVLTMSDTNFIPAKEKEWYIRYIRSIFWPSHGDEPPKERPVFFCSALYGPPVQRLHKALSTMDQKPTWEFLLKQEFRHATFHLFGDLEAHGRENYEEMSWSSLLRRSSQNIEWAGFQETIEGLFRLIIRGPQDILKEDLITMVDLCRAAAFEIRKMLVLSRKATGSAVLPQSDEQRGRVDDVMELVDIWNVEATAFQEDFRVAIEETRTNLRSQVEELVGTSWRSVVNELESLRLPLVKVYRGKGGDDPTVLACSTSSELDQCLSLYQTNFQGLMSTFEDSEVQRLLVFAVRTQAARFGKLSSSKSGFDQDSWLASAKRSAPMSKFTLDAETFTRHASPHEQRYSPSQAFRAVQERVYQAFISTGRLENLHARLSKLHFVSRSLLAMASIIPYLATLPVWLRRLYVDSYRLDVTALHENLVEAAETEVNKHIDQVDHFITTTCSGDVQNAVRGFLETIRDVPHLPNTDSIVVPSDNAQQLVAASANLLAAIASIKYAQSILSHD
ncbi:hypothetical protein FRC18_007705 [Serendipita sp. 400]|nr:hypothetical protein FRC18_007705 [Serendipita sp. 400]